VHRAVGDLARPLVVGQVERAERERAELGAAVEPGGHAVAERGDGVVGVVPAEQGSELPADREQRAGERGAALRRVAGRDQRDEPGEVAGGAGRGQRPHVLEPEVGGQRVDAPGLGEVGGVGELHLACKVSYVHACI